MVQLKLYEKMGGDQGIRSLVNRFYDLMDTLPEAKTIRALHPAQLEESRLKLYEFLSGWSGGPQLYTKKYGHPRLRMRHMPFAIGEGERDEWMLCMRKAMKDCSYDEDTIEFLDQKFNQIADFMRNQ